MSALPTLYLYNKYIDQERTQREGWNSSGSRLLKLSEGKRAGTGDLFRPNLSIFYPERKRRKS